ncbi:VIT domain-containing protein [Planctomicrobium sp. SH661]|uniref:VIT domain-containing protein n=1 Tax=Planctomicrobium sp. SH661 TaxID=3448124 RepID=UPI003F5C3005
MARIGIAICALFLLSHTAFAQGVLVIVNKSVPLPRPIPILPTPPRPALTTYTLNEMSVQATLRDQMADVEVSQTFLNSGTGTIEAQFVFPLPYDGAIDSMTLLVNGKELPAKLLTAADARNRYEEIVRTNKDPALLEWIGTGMFQTSVFPIPAGEKRTVSIHYTQLLRKQGSLIDFLFPLSTARYTAKPVENLNVRIALESSADIKNLYSPTHAVDIKRNGEKHAVVTFEAKQTVPATDFRLLFDSSAGAVGATLLTYRSDSSDEGYFLLLASPEFSAATSTPAKKTLSFVVDKSGSMSGKKIDQAREAARFVLNNLHEGDLFNIISYNNTVAAFRSELEGVSNESRTAGLGYVDSLYAGGGTNIQDALLRSLSELKDEKRPNYLLFLTDGLPTSGETNESRIAAAIKRANERNARLICFGVGYDVNSRLLDRLSRENHGLSEYVRPDENIEAAVARVYQRISSPVLTEIQLTFDLDDAAGSAVSRVYPGGTLDLFHGEQLVVVGRYKRPGVVQINLKGSLEGAEQTHSFPGEFVSKSNDQSNAFIARLWATRRIGEIIDELDLNGTNSELVQELVQLSTQHGILTPYTAFLADKTVRPDVASTSNRERAANNLGALEDSAGKSGFDQRAAKQLFKNADKAPPSPVMSPARVFIAADESSGPGTSATPAQLPLVQKSGTTLYRRGKLMVTPETASLDLNKDQDRITTLVRFTPEYFELIAKNTRSENELLSEQSPDEELLVQFRGVNYLIK